MEYGNIEEFKKLLLYKRITKWDKDGITLEDGTIVTIEESEQDCCASAGGEFSNVVLDAVITNVEIGESVTLADPDEGDDTYINEVKVTIFHNQNPIALAELTADAGNGAYYYSVGSFVVNGIHYKIVEA